MRTRTRKKPIQDPILSALKPEREPRYRPTFYVMLALGTLVGVALNFIHFDRSAPCSSRRSSTGWWHLRLCC